MFVIEPLYNTDNFTMTDLRILQLKMLRVNAEKVISILSIANKTKSV